MARESEEYKALESILPAIQHACGAGSSNLCQELYDRGFITEDLRQLCFKNMDERECFASRATEAIKFKVKLDRNAYYDLIKIMKDTHGLSYVGCKMEQMIENASQSETATGPHYLSSPVQRKKLGETGNDISSFPKKTGEEKCLVKLFEETLDFRNVMRCKNCGHQIARNTQMKDYVGEVEEENKRLKEQLKRQIEKCEDLQEELKKLKEVLNGTVLTSTKASNREIVKEKSMYDFAEISERSSS